MLLVDLDAHSLIFRIFSNYAASALKFSRIDIIKIIFSLQWLRGRRLTFKFCRVCCCGCFSAFFLKMWAWWILILRTIILVIITYRIFIRFLISQVICVVIIIFVNIFNVNLWKLKISGSSLSNLFLRSLHYQRVCSCFRWIWFRIWFLLQLYIIYICFFLTWRAILISVWTIGAVRYIKYLLYWWHFVIFTLYIIQST